MRRNSSASPVEHRGSASSRGVRAERLSLVRPEGSELVASAVDFIAAQAQLHRLGFAQAVGRWLYVHLYAGGDGCIHDPSGAAPTLREIASDPRVRELGLGRSTLHNFVRLHAQGLELSHDARSVVGRLGLSHQVRLLRVRDGEDKVGLARAAVAGHWTVARLEEEIRRLVATERAMAGHERPGRRPQPLVVRRARGAMRASSALLEVVGGLDHVDPSERRALRERLVALLEELDELS